MRALRWHGNRDLRLDDVPVPSPGPGEVLVAVERVGLCGTDVEEFLHGPIDIPVTAPHPRSPHRAPLAPGHEVVGIVVDHHDSAAMVGERVIPEVVEGCGACWWCDRHEPGLCPQLVVLGQHAPGGLADLMVCRASTAVRVPPGVDVDVAAFAEPTSVAVRAVAKAGEVRGAVAAVVGGGVVGNLVQQVVQARGARVVVVDPQEHRRTIALGSGATDAVATPEEAEGVLADLTGGRLADTVFECAGREESFAASVALTRRGGTVVLVGISTAAPPLAWRDVVLGEKRLLGTAAHVVEDVTAAVHLLAAGTVDPAPLLSRVVGLADVPASLRELGAPNCLAKVLVDPSRTS